MFEYFYGKETESYKFYRFPKVLFTSETFINLSNDSKLLYGLMLDRMYLSQKNNWIDKDNRVYIYYPLEDIQDILRCSKDRADKLLTELDANKGIGLIEIKSQGQGKLTMIYVKNFKNIIHDFVKTDTDYNKTYYKENYSNLNQNEEQKRDVDIDSLNDFERYELLIKDNVEYDKWRLDTPTYIDMIDEIIMVMLDLILTEDRTVKINGETKPRNLVRSMFLKINSSDLELIICQFKNQNNRIVHTRSYLRTLIYNCKLENNHHFVNQVNHDFKG